MQLASSSAARLHTVVSGLILKFAPHRYSNIQSGFISCRSLKVTKTTRGEKNLLPGSQRQSEP